MSSTQPSPATEPSTTTGARRGSVTVEAALVIEYRVEFDAPDDDVSAEAVARRRALTGAVREEIDLVTLSAARALKRHLVDKGLVASLTVARGVGDDPPELLVRSGDGG